jgi:uncharacterized membrane protein
MSKSNSGDNWNILLGIIFAIILIGALIGSKALPVWCDVLLALAGILYIIRSLRGKTS